MTRESAGTPATYTFSWKLIRYAYTKHIALGGRTMRLRGCLVQVRDFSMDGQRTGRKGLFLSTVGILLQASNMQLDL